MITAVIASVRHRPGLAAGDAIGANLTMLTLVLGLAALARPLPFGGRVRDYAVWSAAAGGLAAVLIATGNIGRWQGGLLLAAYLAGVALLWWREREPPAIGEATEASEENGESRPALLGLAPGSPGAGTQRLCHRANAARAGDDRRTVRAGVGGDAARGLRDRGGRGGRLGCLQRDRHARSSRACQAADRNGRAGARNRSGNPAARAARGYDKGMAEPTGRLGPRHRLLRLGSPHPDPLSRATSGAGMMGP